MSEATIIKPDLNFVNEIIKGGGESLKKCYQCATCSVVCNVTPEGNPFPRKEMVLAQWGQKDRLIASADVWLCHQCSDCTAYCPRGAKPGEVLNAIRKQSIKEVALVPFFAKIATNPSLVWLLFAIPAALFYAILVVLGNQGFTGPSSLAYHLRLPTAVRSVRPIRGLGWVAEPERVVRHRHFRTASLATGPSAVLDRMLSSVRPAGIYHSAPGAASFRRGGGRRGKPWDPRPAERDGARPTTGTGRPAR